MRCFPIHSTGVVLFPFRHPYNLKVYMNNYYSACCDALPITIMEDRHGVLGMCSECKEWDEFYEEEEEIENEENEEEN